METAVEQQNPRPFVERRLAGAGREGGPERRQFTASLSSANPNVAELSAAVDQYKLRHHRRFITFEELYNVIVELGYHK